MVRRAIAIAGILVVLLTGCPASTPSGQPTGPALTTSPASPSPSSTPNKRRRPTPKARRAVYVVQDGLYLYDVQADRSTRLAATSGLRMPRWVSADEISYLRDDHEAGASALVLSDLKSGESRTLFTAPNGISAYGWSPDRETVAYVTFDDRGDYPEVHYRLMVGEGGTQTVATLARAAGREATDDDEAFVQFSKDGRRVLIVYTPADGDHGQEITQEQAQLQVRTLDGALAFAPKQAAEPTMGIWSPDGKRMWYRTQNGARWWSPETGRVTGAPGAPVWYDPAVSPDGRRIAFDTGSSKVGVRVRVLDLRTGSITTVGGSGRSHPVFAEANTVWVQRVRRCAGECLLPAEPADDVFAIDLKTGEETKIAIRSLRDADVYYR